MCAPSGRELARARWWPGPALAPAELAGIVARAGDVLTGARERKRSRRKALYALALRSAEPDHLLKVNDYGEVPWLRRLRRSRSRLELERARAVAARGIATPLPLAAGELRRRGALERCYLLVPLVPGAIDGAAFWLGRVGDAAERRLWSRELGAFARAMHDAGVFQEDFAPNNFLWRRGAAPRLWAVDFERVALRRSLSLDARVRLLAKLARHLATASAAACMRFLLAYAGGDRAAARRWWRAVERELPRLAQRDLAHFRRIAIRASRRFAPVAHGGFRGFARREAPLPALCGAIQAGSEAEFWIHPLGPVGERDARRAWALAQVLAQRSLSPPPLALLRGRVGAWLVSSRASEERRLDGAPAARPALAVALDRLLAIGADCSGLAPRSFALARGRGPALLLEPREIAAGAPVANRRRRSRALAAELVG